VTVEADAAGEVDGELADDLGPGVLTGLENLLLELLALGDPDEITGNSQTSAT